MLIKLFHNFEFILLINYMKLFDKYNEYFKTNTEKIKKLIGVTDQDNFSLKFYKLDDSKNIIDISDKNNGNLLMRCEYRVIGYFNISSSIWTWAWNNPFIEKSLCIDKDKFMELKQGIKKSNINQKEMEEILYYLDDPAFYISFNNIDRLLKFIMYNIESPMILTKKNDTKNPSVIEIISVKEILQVK